MTTMCSYSCARITPRSGAPATPLLLIGADAPALRALALSLEDQGFGVGIAENIDDGFRMAWKSHPEIIILDVMVSPEGSFSLLKTWRQAGLTTPIIALVSLEDLEEKEGAIDLGADACLIKPVVFQDLLVQIKALRRPRAAGESSALVCVDDLEIDPSLRQARRAGRSIPLTPREFTLLQFLARHQGKVVSRSMIREHLYDANLPSTSNVVDVYIRYLRNKIDKGFARPLIQTRWGEGYVLRGQEA